MEYVIIIGPGIHHVIVYDMNHIIVATYVTKYDGKIIFVSPGNGYYNFICTDKPELSKTNVDIRLSPYSGRMRGWLTT